MPLNSGSKLGPYEFGAPQLMVSNWSMPSPYYQLSPNDRKLFLYRVSQQVSDSVTVMTNFPAALQK
ncbi:MAG TPA: hypothetical protein VMX38_01710 [Verrucomicrobiae bacterium]|jgi:hypothetical protein|nr:hypothetical protein [Verrucomicrobiae bacterium]